MKGYVAIFAIGTQINDIFQYFERGKKPKAR